MQYSEWYIGIDIANAKFDVAFLTGEGRPARAATSHSNDPEGWTEFRQLLAKAASGGTRLVCGMEATSNMHKGLEDALREDSRELHILNPRAVRYFAKALLKDSKTDRIDSNLIAQYLLHLRPRTASAPLPPGLEELREGTRVRRRIIEQRTQAKNHLHALLRRHFPGYQKLLGLELTKRLLVCFSHAPSPQRILATPQHELAAFSYGRGHHPGASFAQNLHLLAAQAPHPCLGPVTEMLIKTAADQILSLDATIAEVDQAIEQRLLQLFPAHPLSTIPGLGNISVASILAEVADVHRFPDKNHFIGYCGLYPIVWESGDAHHRYRMTFKGNRMLKMTFLLASASARQYNPAIAAFYARLRDRNKSTKAAGGAIARKLAEIAFTLLLRNEPWSEQKAMAGIQKAELMSAG